MKKIYISLILLVPGIAYAEDATIESVNTQEPVVISEEKDTLVEPAQNSETNEAEEKEVDRTPVNADDDDFFGDSLDKMIEMGAVNEEVEVKPMSFWKSWLLRVGSGVLARLEAFKKFMTNRYNDAKYIVAAAWAKATGKKLPKRVNKKKAGKKKKKKKGTHTLQQA